MNILTATERDDNFIARLIAIWELSVRKTHTFLTEADIERLGPMVIEALRAIEVLLYALDENDQICGFMGVEAAKIEMLFLHPAARGYGLGRRCVELAMDAYQVRQVDVNEQNSQAVGFYSHLGFFVTGRTPVDDYGNAFPILHMEKNNTRDKEP